jgi:hypothetical protein
METCPSCRQQAATKSFLPKKKHPWNPEQGKQMDALHSALAILQQHGIGLSYRRRSANQKKLRERWRLLRITLKPDEALKELVKFEDTLW